MPTEEEMKAARENLRAHGDKVDFIITHEAPFQLKIEIGLGTDELSDFLGTLKDEIDYNYWFCGHLHRDIDYGNISVVYNRIIEIADWAYAKDYADIFG